MKMRTCLALGAGAMYFLDPQLGRRRRALVRDKFNRLVHELQDACNVLQRDFNNRVQGVRAAMYAGLQPHEADDQTIGERVRAKLGRLCSHPGAIDVSVHDGEVTLSGPILSREVEQIVNYLASIPGVQRVHNELEVHQKADISALQGGRTRPGLRPNILQETWSPTTRALIGGGGVAMLLYGSMRRSPMACLLGTTGLALLARTAANINPASASQHLQSHSSTGTSRQEEPSESESGKGKHSAGKRQRSPGGKSALAKAQDETRSQIGRGKSKVDQR